MMVTLKLKFTVRSLRIATLLMATLAYFAPVANAQGSAPPTPQQPGSTGAVADDEAAGMDAVSEPVLKDYKGVRIGMSADEARQKLGKPASKGELQDFFLISDNETAQVYYDKDGKVNAVSIIYTGKNDAAPTVRTVLGEDVAAGADGRVYKLVRYPTVGYWVAYSRSAGASPVVSVTMKKMRVVPK